MKPLITSLILMLLGGGVMGQSKWPVKVKSAKGAVYSVDSLNLNGITSYKYKLADSIRCSITGTSNLISLNTSKNYWGFSNHINPAYYTWTGKEGSPAMRVSNIDSIQRTTVHLSLKQIVWLNDSTFYIQHKTN